MTVVAHLTTVHSAADPRVSAKECVSLARAGYDVVLVAPDDGAVCPDGVRHIKVTKPRGRVRRMALTGVHVVLMALREHPAVYHIHDPELLPWAVILRIGGRRVIYDVHEDYVSSIRQKRYLPWGLRGIAARLWAHLERALAAPLTVVIAERYYAERFPGSTMVLNYPLLEISGQDRATPRAAERVPPRVLYTGNVTADRGALVHARLLAHHPAYEVHMIGRCSEEVALHMRQAAGAHADRLHLTGVGTYVPFATIRAAYQEGQWLAGLAVFPRTAHYERKELTKFFEYMQAGLPIVCSDLPVWRQLVADQGVGICVKAGDSEALAEALDWLAAHPREAAAMGQRGRELARGRYSWSSQADTLISLYRDLIGE